MLKTAYFLYLVACDGQVIHLEHFEMKVFGMQREQQSLLWVLCDSCIHPAEIGLHRILQSFATVEAWSLNLCLIQNGTAVDLLPFCAETLAKVRRFSCQALLTRVICFMAALVTIKSNTIKESMS